MRVATIPSGLCFVTTLAEGLWRRAGRDPLALSSMLILLPTRRSCRHLREAFLRVTGAKAALLPRMKPLGDVDETDLDFAGSLALDGAPPALSPLRRQMLLMKLVRAKDKTMPVDQAASLAAALAQLLDQIHTEERDFADLTALVPSEIQQHWQETLRFLEIVTQVWPEILQEEGALDPAARRRIVLEAQAEQWQREPPASPVIAAGSTGSIPAVARLMQVIAGLPQGEVILPALDRELDEAAWDAVDETHPQFMMKRWLDGARLSRADVAPWEGAVCPRPAREILYREAMRPAAVSDAWQRLRERPLSPLALEGIERLDVDHPREEADVIALRLRSVLEEDGKTAALVTPDRALAVRVAAALERWGVSVNDSAGSPLPLWPIGSFLIDLLKAAAPSASPVAFLSLLKHPLCATGRDPAHCRKLARRAEMLLWRGVRPADGWRGAARAAKAADEGELAAWLEACAGQFDAFVQEANKPRSLLEWIDAHLALAQGLAATSEQSGDLRLWRGEAGACAVEWLDEWRGAAAGGEKLTGREYASLFIALVQQVMVRPAFGTHPRLSLLGPLEARLLHHDLIILGGLNEGSWPPAPPVDPWMSRPMKRDFGLPTPERRVGQSAHDFVQLASAPQVVLTRAKRSGGSPTVPSRLLLRLEAVLDASGLPTSFAPAQPWRSWARLLDSYAGEPKTIAPPEPCPPLAARPRKASVTEISTWQRNPYAIYARHVLGLKKLEEIDADVAAADYGTVIHEALERFIAAHKESWPADPLAALLVEGRKAFEVYADKPQVQAFWYPRFAQIATWFVANEEKRRAEGIRPLFVECHGGMKLRGGGFTLTGRADRLDLLPDGTVEIIDYKTGAPPSKTQVMAGYEPQLALLAMMASAGAFAPQGGEGPPLTAGALSYWALQARDESKKTVRYIDNLDDQIAKAQAGLNALLDLYAHETTPFEAEPKPHLAPRFNDYAHLSRLDEWGRGKGGES